MEVFLIPVGADRYELYCEVPDEDPSGATDHDRGFFRGLVRKFRDTLNRALTKLRSEGKLGALSAQWLGKDLSQPPAAAKR